MEELFIVARPARAFFVCVVFTFCYSPHFFDNKKTPSFEGAYFYYFITLKISSFIESTSVLTCREFPVRTSFASIVRAM